jgi:magnesium chelatase family protein
MRLRILRRPEAGMSLLAGASGNYRNKISGPLLDRIDIHVEAPAVDYKELSSDERAEVSEAIRERVLAARKLQHERFAGRAKCRANAEMSHSLLKADCKLEPESKELLHRAMEELHLSARAYDRILKVARTIAVLSGRERILPAHLLEAIQYRTLDRNLWH